MRCTNRSLSVVAAIVAVSVTTTPTWGVPYASGVRNTGGSTWQFILNEAADNVTITRDGGNLLELGALQPGRHSFDLESFASFEIGVAKNASLGWTAISDPNNPFTNFSLPSGLAINKDASSPYFGTVYVGNSAPGSTVAGRAMGDGIYALTSDMIGVDLANDFAVVADPNDVTQAKAPSPWEVGASSTSPWRMTLDDGGNLIVSDWSDDNGGIKYASPDLTTGGLVLAFQDGITTINGVLVGLLTNDNGEEVHGSIASKPYVTGTLGQDLTVWAMDEDFDLDKETFNNATSGNHIWRWDVGDVTDGYDQPPELVINSGEVGDGWLNLNVGVRSGAHYDPKHNKWYLVQNRSDGNQTGLVVVTPDDIDGNSPTREWSSLEFSVENGLDGNISNVQQAEGIQDIFRQIGDVTVSPDGSHVLIHKIAFFAGNEVWDLEMGAVMIIPLDENGIPDIQIDDNGTPDDTSDDRLANVETIFLKGNNLAHSTGAQLEFDAAGNLYVANSGLVTDNPEATAQLVQVFSPGGNTLATTGSDGTFNLITLAPPDGLDGDFNNDGIVDAADYTVWRDNLGTSGDLGGNGDETGGSAGVVDQADYEFWKTNFGASQQTALGADAVPEPVSILLALFGASVGGLGWRRRRQPRLAA